MTDEEYRKRQDAIVERILELENQRVEGYARLADIMIASLQLTIQTLHNDKTESGVISANLDITSLMVDVEKEHLRLVKIERKKEELIYDEIKKENGDGE